MVGKRLGSSCRRIERWRFRSTVERYNSVRTMFSRYFCLFFNKSRIQNRCFRFLNFFISLCLSKTSQQKSWHESKNLSSTAAIFLKIINNYGNQCLCIRVRIRVSFPAILGGWYEGYVFADRSNLAPSISGIRTINTYHKLQPCLCEPIAAHL